MLAAVRFAGVPVFRFYKSLQGFRNAANIYHIRSTVLAFGDQGSVLGFVVMGSRLQFRVQVAGCTRTALSKVQLLESRFAQGVGPWHP